MKTCKVLAGIFVFLLLFGYSGHWLSRTVPFVDWRQKQVWEDIYQSKQQISYAFLGSSHVYCGIDTLLAEQQTGKRAVSISSGVQTMTETYYNFAELLQYQTPEIVFIDLYGVYRDFSVRQSEGQGENFTNIDCLRFSPRKIAMAREVFPDTFLPYALFPFLREHENWKNTENINLNWEMHRDPGPYQMGFSGIDTQVSDAQYEGYLALPVSTEPFSVREADRRALQRICQLADKKGIRVEFIMIPWLEEFVGKVPFESVCQAIDQEIAPRRMVAFQGEEYREMGLSRETFIEDKVSDNQHLNIKGAELFTKYLLEGMVQ